MSLLQHLAAVPSWAVLQVSKCVPGRVGGVVPFALGRAEQVVAIAVESQWLHPQTCASPKALRAAAIMAKVNFVMLSGLLA
eukprot:6345945-Amphidinium_carterae.1